MPNIDILVLAIVQGVAEFLPISSSGHLVLIPQFYCWPNWALATEVAAQFGALLALAIYLWRDLLGMAQGAAKVLRGKRDARVRLIGLLLVAALPVLGAGYGAEIYLGDRLRDPLIIGSALVVFGVLLYVADKLGLTVRRVEHMTWGGAFTIGLFQSLAVIPGASRVGIAMTVARILGFERPDAARFALLLSIPVIAATILYRGWQLLEVADAAIFPDAVLVVALSAITGFLAIAFLMYWMRRGDFTLFAVYRLVSGLYVLYVFSLTGGPAC